MQTRILLVDDHRVLCQGMRVLLDREPEFTVVATAHDGREAQELARKHRPEVVVMDISMPELNGIDATRRILEELPATKIIALTVHGDRRTVAEMLAAGAAAYVLKDAAVDELVSAIRTATAGKVYLSPRVAGVVVEQYVHRGEQNGSSGVYERLTAREREVLQLTAEGKATKEVANCLKVSIKTAETHRRSIMEKLGLHSIAELTKYAIREGLTTVEQ
jgi:DNA-binding NarL/FixJ family response regulator